MQTSSLLPSGGSGSNANNRYQINMRKKSSSSAATMLLSDSHSLLDDSSAENSNKSTQEGVEYTLADVYEDAAVIGSELEKIINNYGADVLRDLMPKVIGVLEVLETLTMRRESENDEMAELRMKLNSLEMEKLQRTNERERFERELEEIEDKWKQETLKLINMVNKLKEENKRLSDSLDDTSQNAHKYNDQLGT
jgi:hypothetical protein